MSIPAEKMTVGKDDFDQAVYDLARQWGWSNPPYLVLVDARQTLELRDKPTAVVVDALKLMTQVEAEALLSTKQAHERDTRVLGRVRREVLAQESRIIAAQRGMQYFDKLDLGQGEVLSASKSMATYQAVRECDQFGAVLLTIQGEREVLVFADEDEMRRFNQLTGAGAADSALRKVAAGAIQALGKRDLISRLRSEVLRTSVGDEEQAALRVLQWHVMSNRPALLKLANIHELAIGARATDIHIDPDPNKGGQINVMMRVYGDLEPVGESLSTSEYLEIKGYLLKESGAQIKNEKIRRPLDGNYQYKTKSDNIVNIRASFIPTGQQSISGQDPVSICVRLLPVEKGTVDLKTMRVSADVIQAVDRAVRPSMGLILLAGPTGSGKSTTIAGLLGLHYEIYGDKKYRISLEDPIERFLPGVTQVQIPYTLRNSGEGFSIFFRNYLRHDPDLIWLGEIRDEETAVSSISFASTGHLVVSTIHAENPMEAVERLKNMLPEEKLDMRYAMIKALSLIIGQRLVKRVCKACSALVKPTQQEREFLEYISRLRNVQLQMPSEIRKHDRRGCDAPGCRKGYIGVCPIHEVLELDANVKQVLLSGDLSKLDHLQTSLKVRFEPQVMRLVAMGETEFESLAF